MVKTTKMLLRELSEYNDPFGKINRLLKAYELFLLKKGFYETDKTKPGYLFAPVIYGPSYLSFDYAYMMATPEKAICDKLYTLSPVSSINEMTQLLFDNLRIDETEFQRLNTKTLEELSELYKSNNIRYMIKTLKKVQNELKY